MKYKKTQKGNQKQRPHTTLLMLRKMQQNYTKPTQKIFIILWRSYCTCESAHAQTYIWQYNSYAL